MKNLTKPAYLSCESMHHLIDAKEEITDACCLKTDIFVSAYNDSARVQQIYQAVSASTKKWWIVPEYGYSIEEINHLPDHTFFAEKKESDLIINGMKSILPLISAGTRLCIDITGLMRNHVLFLIKFLKEKGVAKFDIVYTEPSHYSRGDETTFSTSIKEVRQVQGYEGEHDTDGSNDVLLLGVGYDYHPMARTILYKENARLVQLLSLPSLSADMYQESLLRLARVTAESSLPREGSLYFASANDPFVVASVLSEAWSELSERRTVTNIYLCPLATKVQALGFGLFFLSEMQSGPASIILPSVESYSRSTSTGVGRTWLYPIQL